MQNKYDMEISTIIHEHMIVVSLKVQVYNIQQGEAKQCSTRLNKTPNKIWSLQSRTLESTKWHTLEKKLHIDETLRTNSAYIPQIKNADQHKNSTIMP